MEEKKTQTTMTIDELVNEFNAYKQKTDEEVTALKLLLDEEKRKNAQYSILGVTQKVETKQVNDEPVEFDFYF